MVRYIIADEGTDILKEVFLAEGAIKWDPNKKIIVTNSNFDVIGQATDIQRDGKHLTAEVNVVFPDHYQCTFYLANLESHVYKGVQFVTGGTLMEISVFAVDPEVGLDPAVPKENSHG